MKIVVAPDSFKGSISSKDLCTAVKTGIHRVFPDAEVIEIPLADGGEGMMESLVYATSGSKKEANVTDPLGRPILAQYGVLGDGKTAVIEMAQASGLPLLSPDERNPLRATTYGTGQLLLAALDDGYDQFIIGLGGSATNDGGTGMLRALGVNFYDENDELLEEDLTALQQLAKIDVTGMDPRLKKIRCTIASDVTNPLCGPKGATAIFGPQKGVTDDMIPILDSALENYGKVIHDQFGIEIIEAEGAGAAGGLGAALVAFLDGEMQSGIDILLDVMNFQEMIKGADLIITGEGKLDQQTLSGKVISGVSKRAEREYIPVIVLCGSNELDSESLDQLGVAASFSIVPGPCSLDEAFFHTKEWAENQSEQIMRLINSSILFT